MTDAISQLFSATDGYNCCNSLPEFSLQARLGGGVPHGEVGLDPYIFRVRSPPPPAISLSAPVFVSSCGEILPCISRYVLQFVRLYGTLIFIYCGTITLLLWRLSGGGCRGCRLPMVCGFGLPFAPTALVVPPSLTLFLVLSPFLHRLYSIPLTTTAVSKYHIPRIVPPSLLPGCKTPCSS